MRITEGSMAFDLLSNINKSKTRILQWQAQLANMKRVLKPSDDPQAAQVIMRLNGMLARNGQYQKNITEGQAMVETTNTSLEQFSSIIQDARDTMTAAMNDPDPAALANYADRIDQLLSDAVDSANTQFNGRYIFGGLQSTSAPFILAPDRSAVTTNPAGITGTIQYPVGDGVSTAVNIDGQTAFNGTAAFDLLIQVRDALRAGTLPTQAQLTTATSVFNYVTDQSSKAGAMLQGLESSAGQLDQQKSQIESLIAVQQDVDTTDLVMKLKREQNSLDAALTIGASILPKSLVDFLK
jgi:flagellar hook-associated protein 3 FlgL